jgi:hypothetical protein
LPEILAVILCGTLAGAEDFVEIERWARQKLDFLRRRAEGSAGDVAGLPLHSPHQQTVATDNLIKASPPPTAESRTPTTSATIRIGDSSMSFVSTAGQSVPDRCDTRIMIGWTDR